MTKILSFGAIYLDINAINFPLPDNANELVNIETVGKEYEMVLGGSAVNFVRFCKNLGITSYFIGKVGQDNAGTILKKLFHEEGIHPLLFQSSHFQTNVNTNLVGKIGTSLMLSFGTANQTLTSQDVMEQLEKYIDEIDVVYIGGVFKLKNILQDLVSIVDFVKKKDKKVILDHGRVVNTVTTEEKEIMRNIAYKVDYYLPSKDEFLELWNVNSTEEGLKIIAKSDQSQPLVVVKDAKVGAWTMENNKLINVSSFNVSPTNTIGAGDSFNAGFIAAISEGKFLEESIRFANATAALKISTQQTPTKNTVNEFLLTQHSL